MNETQIISIIAFLVVFVSFSCYALSVITHFNHKLLLIVAFKNSTETLLSVSLVSEIFRTTPL